MTGSSGANAYSGTIAIGAHTGVIAVLSTALDPDQGQPPASGTVNVSIGSSASSSAMLQQRGAQAATQRRVWAADLFFAAGSRPAAQTQLPTPALVDGHPDQPFLDSLAALARNGVHSSSPPAQRRSALASATVGAGGSFSVSQAAIGTGGGGYTSVAATLRATSAHANVWIDNTLGTLDATAAQRIAADFENAYDSDTRHFGSVEYTSASPGARVMLRPCDASGRQIGGALVPMFISPGGRHAVLIVNQTTLGNGMGGYFSAMDYETQAIANCSRVPSNELPLIVLGYAPGADLNYALDEDFVRGTAHELQHAINFVQHYILAPTPQVDSTWINEGLSMLAQDFAVSELHNGTPNLDVDDALARAQEFLRQPEAYNLTGFDCATGSSGFTYNCSGSYGESYLFERYLYDRFGGDAFTLALESGSAAGVANLQAVTRTPVQQLISDFGVALAVSGLHVTSDPRFAFTAFNPYGSYTDQFGGSRTFNGPAVTTQTPGTSVTYPSVAGTFRYFATQPNAAQGAGVTVTDTAGPLQLAPALIQH
jgi:hypothetical protein